MVQVVINYGNAPPGNSQTRLLISSNDPDESPWPGGVLIDVTTLATGGPEYSSDPVGGSTLAFGSQQINTESTPMLVEVSNDGTENLTLACVLSGSGASSFNLKACATPVAAQGSTNLSVSCVPVSTGVKTAQLTVTTNDADEGEVSYHLSCTGVAPPNEDIIHADGFENL